MHARYTLSKRKNNEWFTYCKDDGKYYSNMSKSALVYELRQKNDSKYVNLRKNILVVSIAALQN